MDHRHDERADKYVIKAFSGAVRGQEEWRGAAAILQQPPSGRHEPVRARVTQPVKMRRDVEAGGVVKQREPGCVVVSEKRGCGVVAARLGAQSHAAQAMARRFLSSGFAGVGSWSHLVGIEPSLI